MADENEAKTLFENLKKRYNKKKNIVKKADRSGTSASEKAKAKKIFEPYKYLQWLEQFIVPRPSRSNLSYL